MIYLVADVAITEYTTVKGPSVSPYLESSADLLLPSGEMIAQWNHISDDKDRLIDSISCSRMTAYHADLRAVDVNAFKSGWRNCNQHDVRRVSDRDIAIVSSWPDLDVPLICKQLQIDVEVQTLSEKRILMSLRKSCRAPATSRTRPRVDALTATLRDWLLHTTEDERIGRRPIFSPVCGRWRSI